MITTQSRDFAILWLVLSLNASAGTLYVDLNCTSPTLPYTNWTTAATNIQDAIDAATNGDLVLVTNGVYQTGGHVVFGFMTNRVAITKPLTVQSVNGPDVTIVQGYQIPGLGCGDGAVRCCYLTNGATITGFTLANGATRTSGDSIHEQRGGGIWCEDTTANIFNCTVVSNLAYNAAGGSYYGSLSNCLIVGNSATNGIAGGTMLAMLNHCLVASNSAARHGGGTYFGGLSYCILVGNSTGGEGGGSWSSPMVNCSVFGNSALIGGGVFSGGAQMNYYNCTIAGNTAAIGGGTAGYSKLYNCIIYHNPTGAGPEVADGIQGITEHCCTTVPLYFGLSTITNEPRLTDISHIASNSPCLGAGSATYATGKDLDGEAWANPPSIGCDEFNTGTTGPLNVTILGATNLTTGFAANYIAQVLGHAGAGAWDFGDGTVISNSLFASHSWSAPGVYQVTYRAFNDGNPGEVPGTTSVQVSPPLIHYVSIAATNPVPPFTNWATAATSIQDAVDVAFWGDQVLVSNGVYSSGQRTHMSGAGASRLVVTKPVTVRSLNGPAFTVIQGYQIPGTVLGAGAVRCVYLADGAALCGFTITGGATELPTLNDDFQGFGGGALCGSTCSTVSNCILIGNSSAKEGGGVFGGTLNNCVIASNSTSSYSLFGDGGGAAESMLNNCLLVSNWAYFSGGGSFNGALTSCTVVANSAGQGGGLNLVPFQNRPPMPVNNCIVVSNTASVGPNYFGLIDFNQTCTAPLPTNGLGDITGSPLFVDAANGNFQLQSNSPCINSGNNSLAPTDADLDGNPRIAGGTVDIGAYEFQSPASIISYAWLQQYNLATDGSADSSDSDSDGMNNWQEWRAGTVPTNAASLLLMLSPTASNSNLVVTWQSVTNHSYYLQRASDPAAIFLPLATNIMGQTGTTSFTDTNAPAPGPWYYRVGVQ